LIQSSSERNKKLPKNYVLFDAESTLQTKLTEIDEEETFKILHDKFVPEREGFLCIKSIKNVTVNADFA